MKVNRTPPRLGKQLLLYVVVFGSVVTFFITIFQLYSEYRFDIDRLEQMAAQIETSYLNGIVTATWNLDDLQMKVLLEGLVALPDVVYAKISIDSGEMAQAGARIQDRVLPHTWDLEYADKHLGYLYVQISKENVYASLLERAVVVLFGNFLRTFLIAAFILFIVEWMITRHLRKISGYFTEVNEIEGLENTVQLAGKRTKPNEIDYLVADINELFQKLRGLWGELQVSENNFKKVMQTSQGAMLIAVDNEIEYYNSKLLDSFQVDSVEEIPWDLFTPHWNRYESCCSDDDLEKLIECVNEEGIKSFDIEVSDDSGERIYQCYSSAVLWNMKLANLLFLFDVTDQRLREKEERNYELQLIQADKMNSLDVMVSGITHEINNPNNLIKINAGVMSGVWEEVTPVLDEHYSDSEQQLQNIPYGEMKELIPGAINDMIEASKRIERIVDGLKVFIRGNANDMELDEGCEIGQIIDDVLRAMQPYIKKKDIEISRAQETEIPSFICKRTLINQVFVNILLNSIEASKEEQGIINIICSYDEGFVVVVVEDFGMGIGQEKLGNIFDLFQSTKKNQGGTGLGLSIAYSIVRQHGGNIHVESEVGKGTRMTVRLPVIPPEESPEIE